MNQGLIDTLSLDCLKRNDETAKFKVKWGISPGVGNSEETGCKHEALSVECDNLEGWWMCKSCNSLLDINSIELLYSHHRITPRSELFLHSSSAQSWWDNNPTQCPAHTGQETKIFISASNIFLPWCYLSQRGRAKQIWIIQIQDRNHLIRWSVEKI